MGSFERSHLFYGSGSGLVCDNAYDLLDLFLAPHRRRSIGLAERAEGDREAARTERWKYRHVCGRDLDAGDECYHDCVVKGDIGFSVLGNLYQRQVPVYRGA